MNAAEALVEMLKAYQTRHVFGVPGDTSMLFYDALRRARGEITHVMGRDERSTSFMADAYARISGRPGVCEAPSGAGATYIIPGVAEAHGSSVPMVVFTSDVPVVDEGRETLTAIDQVRLFEAATKWNTMVKRPEMLPDVIRRAFRLATSGRMGAVHVVLPEDVLHEVVPADASLHCEPACRHAPAYRTQALDSDLRPMLTALAAAERPIVVAGGGVRLSGAWTELTRLAERLELPVGTTINGKGSIAETHPLSLGVIGDNGARPYANEVLTQADCVLFVGTRINSLVTLGGRVPAAGATVLQLDVDPAQLGNNVPVDIPACGDARASLAALGRLADENSSMPTNTSGAHRREQLEALSRSWWEEVHDRAACADYPMTPQRVISAVRRVTPEDGILVADPGTMTPFTAAQFVVERGGRNVVIPRAHGGLGYAIPASVGAAFARPGERIVALTGDGSFGMSGTELETIARLHLPITVVHFNNGTFGWIKMLQRLYFDQRYFGVDFSPSTNYAGVAQGLGVPGVRIEEADQLDAELVAAADRDGPAFLDVSTRSELEELPPVEGWRRAVRAASTEDKPQVAHAYGVKG